MILTEFSPLSFLTNSTRISSTKASNTSATHFSRTEGVPLLRSVTVTRWSPRFVSITSLSPPTLRANAALARGSSSGSPRREMNPKSPFLSADGHWEYFLAADGKGNRPLEISVRIALEFFLCRSAVDRRSVLTGTNLDVTHPHLHLVEMIAMGFVKGLQLFVGSELFGVVSELNSRSQFVAKLCLVLLRSPKELFGCAVLLDQARLESRVVSVDLGGLHLRGILGKELTKEFLVDEVFKHSSSQVAFL